MSNFQLRDLRGDRSQAANWGGGHTRAWVGREGGPEGQGGNPQGLRFWRARKSC